MKQTFTTTRFAVVAVALVLSAGLVQADDSQLRQKALRLNDITGEDAIKAKIVELYKDKDAAKKLIAEAIEMSKDPEKDSPFNYNGAYILARLSQATKDFDASLSFYKVCRDQAVKIRSGQKLVQVYDGLIGLFFDNKKFENAVAACQEFLDYPSNKDVDRVKPFVMEKMIQAMAKAGKVDEATKAVDRLIERTDGMWYFVRLKAEILGDAGKVTEAVNAYEEAIDKAKVAKGDDDNGADKVRKEAKENIRAGMEEVIVGLIKQTRNDDAIRLADELTKADWYFARLKAEVLREAGRLDDAVVAFEDAIARVTKVKTDDADQKKRILDRCRYVLSGVFTDLKQVEKAASQLQALLKENPESATYHNDLGYIWADHSMNLDESEKLIRKALELDRAEREKAKKDGKEEIDDKDNPAYLDSLGWVLFKKKDYAGAKKYLIEATKNEGGQHVEIYDHLADVHMAMGEKDEAIAVWKKAVKVENVARNDDKRKEAVKKKLEAAESK